MKLFKALKNLLLAIVGYLTTVNCAPTCVEPTDLQARFSAINGGLDYRTLFFTAGWSKITFESDFERLFFLSTTEMSDQCPSTFRKGDYDMMFRSSCPWFLQMTTFNLDTYPRKLFQANSRCERCIGASGDQKCEKIQHKIRTLEKTGVCENGVYTYQEVDTYIPIAFTCAQPREVENSEQVTPPPAMDGPPTM